MTCKHLNSRGSRHFDGQTVLFTDLPPAAMIYGQFRAPCFPASFSLCASVSPLLAST